MEDMLRDRVGGFAEVELEPQCGSHTTGSDTIIQAGSGLRAKLNLSGVPKANTAYLAHIHPGTCAEEDEGADHEEG